VSDPGGQSGHGTHPGLVLTCSDAQNVEWWTKMCSDERLFVQWWSKKKEMVYVVFIVTRVESKV